MGKHMTKCTDAGHVTLIDDASPVADRTRRPPTLAGKRKRSAPAESRRPRRRRTPPPEKSNDPVSASSCASSGSSDLVQERLRSEEDLTGFESVEFERRDREATPSSNLQSESYDLESTAGSSRRKPKAGGMPSLEEMEEFFSATEKEQVKQFEEKYNFDLEKEVPLEGRWEWVRLK